MSAIAANVIRWSGVVTKRVRRVTLKRQAEPKGTSKLTSRTTAALTLCLLLLLPSRGFARPESFDDGEYTVHYLDDPNSQNALFNGDTLRMHQQYIVVSCEYTLGIHVGPADGDDIYAGLCQVERDKVEVRAMVCGDEMVGNVGFDVVKTSGPVPAKTVADFMETHCIGG